MRERQRAKIRPSKRCLMEKEDVMKRMKFQPAARRGSKKFSQYLRGSTGNGYVAFGKRNGRVSLARRVFNTLNYIPAAVTTTDVRLHRRDVVTRAFQNDVFVNN